MLLAMVAVQPPACLDNISLGKCNGSSAKAQPKPAAAKAREADGLPAASTTTMSTFTCAVHLQLHFTCTHACPSS